MKSALPARAALTGEPLLLLDPGLVVGHGENACLRAHGRVPQPAELGADDLVLADLRRLDHRARRDPLTASCFIRHSGTQNEWITSFEVIMNSIAWSTGTTSSPVVSGRPPSTSMSG